MGRVNASGSVAGARSARPAALCPLSPDAPGLARKNGAIENGRVRGGVVGMRSGDERHIRPGKAVRAMAPYADATGRT